MGIDGDQFEVEARAEFQQAIVGAHSRVPAAGRERRAEMPFQPCGTGVEVAGGKDEVVRNRHGGIRFSASDGRGRGRCRQDDSRGRGRAPRRSRRRSG